MAGRMIRPPELSQDQSELAAPGADKECGLGNVIEDEAGDRREGSHCTSDRLCAGDRKSQNECRDTSHRYRDGSRLGARF
jgi:hypothetical protein